MARRAKRSSMLRPGHRDDERVPVVLAFHGRGDNMQNFQHTNVHMAWPEAIVVYFQGLQTRGRLTGWQVERDDDVNRDLKLVDEALTSLRSTYNVDDDRIYATGFSNGGMFTYLLWAERPRRVRRLRPGGRPPESFGATHTARPLFHVAGERDRQVSFSDQEAAIEVAIK